MEKDKKIIDYGIVEAWRHYDLVDQVNQFIKEGYQPTGELVISPDGKFHQVVVKYEEVKTNQK